MAYDAISVLREAGSPVDQLSDAQLTVLGTLTPAEVDILADVQGRMAAVCPEVEGHLPLVGVVIF
jgi:hypothetical protein